MKLQIAVALFGSAVICAAQPAFPSGYIAALKDLQKFTKVEVLLYLAENPKFSCLDPDTPESMKKFCFRLNGLVDLNRQRQAFAEYVLSGSTLSNDAQAKAAFGAFLRFAESKRLDEQFGASVAGSGTSSIASRVGITDVLNMAVESGAVTQSTNGNSATLQANTLSLYRFLVGQEVMPNCIEAKGCEKGVEKFLKDLTVSSNFDLTHPSTKSTTGTTTTSSGANAPVTASILIRDNAVRLSSFTVRYQFYNRMNLRSNTYKAAFKEAFGIKNTTLIQAAADEIVASETLDQLVETSIDWTNQTIQILERRIRQGDDLPTMFKGLQALFQAALDKRVTDANDQKLLKADELLKFYKAGSAFAKIHQETLAAIQKKTSPGFSVEYTNLKPVMQPRTSNVRAIMSLQPAKMQANFTLNFGATLYDTQPTGTASRWKDLQFALQLDRHLGLTKLGDTSLTLAGYYQYQHESSAIQIGQGDLAPGTNIQLPGGTATLLAPKGHLAVAQAQISVKTQSGTKIPIGVTWSNRTELIKAKEVRGHIGYSFDWDSIFGSKGN